MGYRNGKDILPPALLEQIQQYVDGESIYIPKVSRQAQRAPGPLTERNREICRRHADGCSVRSLAETYFLSPQAIYKILAEEEK